MTKIIDNWFLQNDIIKLINSHKNFSEDFTLLYEATDSALEHLVYYSIPIPLKRINERMNHETWGEDDYLTRNKILLLRGNHYLSVSFRRFFNVSYWSSKYFSESKKVYGKMEENENFGSKSKKCYVLTEAIIEYLKFTNQVLLFGIRSHRYSERKLNEFLIKTLGEKYKNNQKNYSFLLQPISDRGSIYHKQIKSMSIVFGKYYVPIN